MSDKTRRALKKLREHLERAPAGVQPVLPLVLLRDGSARPPTPEEERAYRRGGPLVLDFSPAEHAFEGVRVGPDPKQAPCEGCGRVVDDLPAHVAVSGHTAEAVEEALRRAQA